MASVPVRLLNLGRVSYKYGFDLMKQSEFFHINSDDSFKKSNVLNTLIVMEHPPTYTVGTRTDEYLKLDHEAELRKMGAEYVFTDRGGLITFHGPGQIVSYPVLNLHDFGLTPRAYVGLLEKWMIDTCQEYQVEAHRSSEVGVWVGNNKIGALGVHIRHKHITTHGICLNCNVDLLWFSHIIACGLKNKGSTSLTRECRKNVTIQDAIPVLLNHFTKNFNAVFKLY